MLELHPAETEPPCPEELTAYRGLKEIRFRRDSALEVGLFLRKKDKATVIGFASPDGMPFTFEVPSTEANLAFIEPWPYAPDTGKAALQGILEKNSSTDD